MVDHDVMWLDISVHDTLAVTEIEGLEELIYVISDIVILELGIERSEIGIVDMLKDKTRGLAHGIANDIEKSDDIGTAREVLQDFDFALDLLLLNRLENLDDALLVIDDIDALEDFRVLSPSCRDVEFSGRFLQRQRFLKLFPTGDDSIAITITSASTTNIPIFLTTS